MLKSRYIPVALLVLCLAGFALGVIRLFAMRFDAGDIYPAYSSLRTDPLGAKAFYESLQSFAGLGVSRFIQRNSKLEGGPQRVLFLFGVDRTDLASMSADDDKTLTTFLYRGGRIVISLLPVATLRQDEGFLSTNSTSRSRSTGPQPKPQPTTRDKTNSDPSLSAFVSFFAKTGVGVKFDDLSVDEEGRSHSELADAVRTPSGLPPLLSWHSGAYFDLLDTNWRTVYQRKRHPVLIERSFGAGSLVLSTDSYFVSNEALRRERHADLLAWLAGGRGEIIFDETHLGVQEQPGVAALMRRYHMEGVLLALALLAGLFIWKNSLPLVPPPTRAAEGGERGMVQGKEAGAGFASLLRRAIPPSDVLFTCFAEWKSACARQPRAAARLAAIEKMVEEQKALSPSARRPVETWQTIQKILAEREL